MHDLFKDKKMFNADLSRWDVSRVVNMSSMFQAASSLTLPPRSSLIYRGGMLVELRI